MCLVAFQKIFRKIFSGVWKRRRKTQIQKKSSTIAISPARSRDQRRRRDLAIDASRDRDLSQRRDHDQLRDLATARDREIAISRRSSNWRSVPRARSLSLSLSLFFRKCFEVKMRGENYFRVKCENIGQPKVIFRKILLSVTAKHAEKGENDFLKSISPKTNAPKVAK